MPGKSRNIFFLLLFLILSSCGGGPSNPNPNNSSSKSNQQTSSLPTVNLTTLNIPFSYWIGQADTQFTFTNTTLGYEFFISSDKNCNWKFYVSCENGKTYTLSGNPILDSNINSSHGGYTQLKDITQAIASKLIAPSKFSPRSSHQLVYFHNKFWLIGGLEQDAKGKVLKNDIWSSTDGDGWIKETENAEFEPRSGHQVFEFNDKLFLIGGYGTNSGRLSDIWTSSDGVHWMQANHSNAFGTRVDHRIIKFNNKLWLIGGSSSYISDIWSSEDGLIWIQRPQDGKTIFSPRANHQLAVFKDKLWLIGGNNGGTPTNDIWSSADGINWSLEIDKAAFSPRDGHQTFILNNKIYLLGGGSRLDIVKDSKNLWESEDGVHWAARVMNLELSYIGYHQIASNNGKILFVGGYGVGATNGVWASEDGYKWSPKENNEPNFLPRADHELLIFKNRLWLIGGNGGAEGLATGSLADMWSTADGADWRRESISNISSPAKIYASFSFNNKLWIYGNEAGNEIGVPLFVWSSADGENWVKESAKATGYEFTQVPFQRMVSLNNILWIVSGSAFDDYLSSPDGLTWTKRIANVKFSSRILPQVVSFKKKIWLIGGREGNDKNDVWSTPDGINWSREIEHAAFSPREGHQVIEFNNKLWLIGGSTIGVNGGHYNDIWSSSDGITWQKEVENAPFPERTHHKLIVFNGQLVLIGGQSSAPSLLKDVWVSTDGISWRRGYHGVF